MNQLSFPWLRLGLLLAAVFTTGVFSGNALTQSPADADLWPMLWGFALLIGCSSYLGWGFVQKVRGRKRTNTREDLSAGRIVLILLLFIGGVPLADTTAEMLKTVLPAWLAGSLPWLLFWCAVYSVAYFARGPRRRADGRA